VIETGWLLPGKYISPPIPWDYEKISAPYYTQGHELSPN